VVVAAPHSEIPTGDNRQDFKETGMFTNASAVYHGNHVAISFPFDRTLVDRFKNDIPAHARTYVPETKTWLFESAYAARAVGLLTERFPDALVENAPGPHVATVSDYESEYLTLFVIPAAPPEVVKAAYRALSKLYHPDKGGDTTTMQRINEAYSHLESRLASGERV